MPKVKHLPEPGNEAPVVEKYVVKLQVPVELHEQYEELAEKQGLTVEELMLHRLVKCRDFSGMRPLFFSDPQRSQLEGILQKRPLENADQALQALTACLSIRVGEFPPIPLPGPLAKRIFMGTYRGETPFEHLQNIILPALHKAVGL